MTTKIEWTHRPGTTGETWNPVTGCTKISAGCQNCYAERMARRLAGRCGYPAAPHHFDVTLHPDRLEQPLRWRKPRTVFVVSMGDLFHEDVPTPFIIDVWRIMRDTPQHTYQVLTKRPQAMLSIVTDLDIVLPNVWLGVTAENQRTADERIPLLLQTPAAVRFVSVEPCLSAIDLSWFLRSYPITHERHVGTTTKLVPALDFVIVGGESGPGARPMHPDWARSLRDQCQAAGTAFLMKQWGNWVPIGQIGADEWENATGPVVYFDYYGKSYAEYAMADMLDYIDRMKAFGRVGKKAAGRLLDGREWNEWPR